MKEGRREQSRFGFVHQAVAEFLAARYLATNAFSLPQLLSLMRVPGGDELRIAPPLFDVAAWLASKRREFFEAVVAVQPAILVRADLVAADQRRRVLLGLLAQVQAGTARKPEAGSYRHLRYDGMHQDLEPWLARERALDVRRLACDIAEECAVTALADRLVEIALDASEHEALRLDTALAIVRIGPEEAKRRLRPLVFGEAGADPRDDLKGAGLMATWPNHLSEDEFFASLTPEKRRNCGGLYAHFRCGEVGEKLPPTALAEGVRWAKGEIGYRQGVSSYDLAGKIVTRALHHLEDPDVQAAVVEFVLACHSEHTSVLEPKLGLDEDDPILSRMRVCGGG